MKKKRLFDWFIQHPQKLFVVDGVGALVSALIWGVVFSQFTSIIGLPTRTCYFLASFPVLFMLFDFASYRWSKRLYINLRCIALMNVGYVFVSGVIMFGQIEYITFFGYVYLFFEITIVLFLARFENIVACELKGSRKK